MVPAERQMGQETAMLTETSQTLSLTYGTWMGDKVLRDDY